MEKTGKAECLLFIFLNFTIAFNNFAYTETQVSTGFFVLEMKQ